MLKVEFNRPVLRLTLARPEVRNAFDDLLIDALLRAFQEMPSEARVVVLAAEGKAFCGGGDLNWMRRMAAMNFEENVADASQLASLFHAIAHCPAITVVRVQGAAFGGGCGLVAAADVAVASTDALFAFSEVRLGLIPATIAPYVISKIGAGHARALFTTGEAFGAERALRIGLVHEVVEPTELDAAVEAKVAAILKSGPKATIAARNLVLDGDLNQKEYAARLAMARSSDEGKEGVAAFLEKRPATFVEEHS